jgi:hypothetical protein
VVVRVVIIYDFQALVSRAAYGLMDKTEIKSLAYYSFDDLCGPCLDFEGSL